MLPQPQYNWVIYCMRHTFVSYVYDKDKRQSLQKALGHSGSMNTERYKHGLDIDKVRMAETINEAFADITTELKKAMGDKVVTNVVPEKK